MPLSAVVGLVSLGAQIANTMIQEGRDQANANEVAALDAAHQNMVRAYNEFMAASGGGGDALPAAEQKVLSL